MLKKEQRNSDKGLRCDSLVTRWLANARSKISIFKWNGDFGTNFQFIVILE